MPAGKESEGGSNPAQRTTFRPPWVKEGPNPLPVPAAPWSLKNTRRDSTKETATENNPLAGVQLRKTSIQTKEPQENGSKENTFKKPQLRPVPPKEEVVPKKNDKLPEVKLNSVAERIKNEPKRPPLQRMSTKESNDEEIDRAVPAKRNALVREESMRRLSQTPAPPPMPPPAPAMPGSKMKKLTQQQADRLELLKARPKARPDWSGVLKEIESSKKLKHVQCNDRSQPLLPKVKTEEEQHFVFESEVKKNTAHNVLLKQIAQGVHLKKVKTNDRSRPMLDGLRKFRRQMTIEEQIQKSVSMASMPPEEIEDEADEMDDIDKVRDDLQSTKQMLALELRNKEAQIRENKRLLSRIQNLEAELEKERNKEKAPSGATKASAADEKIIQSLKKESEQSRKSVDEVEKKYKEVTEQLDNTKFQLEDVKRQNQALEKKLQEAVSGKRQSISKDMTNGGEDSENEFADEESSEESDGEETEEKKEKRAVKELKHMRNKLRSYKIKEDNAKKERTALKSIMKTHQLAIKEEKKKFKALQKEVDKMAALMKDVGDDEDEEDDEEKEESEEEVEEEESTEESDSEDSDDTDSEKSQSEPEDAPVEKKKSNLDARSNRHEKRLAALKKGNFMMKANAERLQDDLNKQKELTAGLQLDLDSVLAELG